MAFFFMLMFNNIVFFFAFACVHNYICSVFRAGTDGVGGFFPLESVWSVATATPHQPTSRCATVVV